MVLFKSNRISLRDYLSIDAKHIIKSLKRQQNKLHLKMSIEQKHRGKHCGPRLDCSYRSSLI